MSEPTYLHPTAPLAERVLLPDDPGVALALAQAVLEQPKMFNHHRGLWGYTGPATRDGRALTIQSTGIGGPSAAIVVSELAQLGARRMIRVGACRALSAALAPGEALVAAEAICDDGTSRALTGRLDEPDPRVDPDADRAAGIDRAGNVAPRVRATRGLLAALLRAAGPGGRAGVVVSTDLFYDRPSGETARWARLGADAVELETATVLALAERRGLEVGSVLLVTGGGSGATLAAEQRQAGERRIAGIAVAALSV